MCSQLSCGAAALIKLRILESKEKKENTLPHFIHSCYQQSTHERTGRAVD